MLELLVVEGEDGKIEMGKFRTREPVEIRICERLRQLDFSLAAPAAEDDRVAVLNPAYGLAAVVQDNDRVKVVVGLPPRVLFVDGDLECRGTARGWTFEHGAPPSQCSGYLQAV